MEIRKDAATISSKNFVGWPSWRYHIPRRAADQRSACFQMLFKYGLEAGWRGKEMVHAFGKATGRGYLGINPTLFLTIDCIHLMLFMS